MHADEVSKIFEKETEKNLFKIRLSFTSPHFDGDKISSMSTKALCRERC
jgi:hypothetical protein